MSNKNWKITVDEDELKALISYQASRHNRIDGFDVERSQRIHDLTKRLNKKDEAETEKPAENVKDVVVPAAWG